MSSESDIHPHAAASWLGCYLATDASLSAGGNQVSAKFVAEYAWPAVMLLKPHMQCFSSKETITFFFYLVLTREGALTAVFESCYACTKLVLLFCSLTLRLSGVALNYYQHEPLRWQIDTARKCSHPNV